MINIILVEDHKMVRQGIKVLLEAEQDFNVIGEAEHGKAAIQQVKRLQPDILVTDLVMKGMNGIKVTELVRKYSPKTEVIILSMYDNAPYVSAALEAGAKGYVIKGSGVDELINAIYKVLSGCRYLGSPLSEQKIDAYKQKSQTK